MELAFRRIRPVFEDYARDYGLALAVSGTLTVGAIADRILPWYFITVFAIGVFGIVLFVLNQMHKYVERFPLSPSDKRLKQSLTEWLLRDGYTVRDNNHESCYIDLVATDASRNLTIRRLRSRDDELQIISIHKMNEENLLAWNALTAERRREIIDRLRIEIAQTGVPFSGLDDPPAEIRLIESVLIDPTINSRILGSHLVRVLAAVVVLRTIVAAVGREAPSPTSGA
jgi:hypothetical protein